MNEKEWDIFKDILPNIAKHLPKCAVCKDKKVKTALFNDKMMPTKLTPEQLEDVKENNKTAYNQLAGQCEYCGDNYSYDKCHCHSYNCRECEPANFCQQCGDVTVVSL